jgi:uncharacterized membrane protein
LSSLLKDVISGSRSGDSVVPNHKTDDEKDTGRLEAFSDGIFAIAVTLLILDIKVPTPRVPGTLRAINLNAALLAQWPAYLAYVISFMTVLIMWVNHHKLFLHIRRVDHVFLVLNGLLLMGVTVVPFPTALLAAFINTPGAKTAGAVFNGTFLVIAILFFVLWRYASQGRRLLARSLNVETAAAITRQFKFGPPLYILAFVFSLVNMWAGLSMCAALAVFFAFPGVNEKKRRLEPSHLPSDVTGADGR